MTFQALDEIWRQLRALQVGIRVVVLVPPYCAPEMAASAVVIPRRDLEPSPYVFVDYPPIVRTEEK